MLEIFQEAVLPKLSQTSLFHKFEKENKITTIIGEELKSASENAVKPDDIAEILSLIKLNGDTIVKKAVDAFTKGEIIIIYNELSKIPISLPYMIVGNGDTAKAYIFVNKIMNNLKASNQYPNLMAVMEAAYLGLQLNRKQNTFLTNRQLVLILCNIYQLMVVAPLEQKLYMKGDNLTKAMLYIITYFYRMIDGPDDISIGSIPFKRIIADKVDDDLIKKIIEDIKSMEDMSFISLLQLITNINPVRYKNIEQTYMGYFVQTCGSSLIFAIENLQYLFLLITSAKYKTQLTSFGVNKLVTPSTSKAITTLTSMNV